MYDHFDPSPFLTAMRQALGIGITWPGGSIPQFGGSPVPTSSPRRSTGPAPVGYTPGPAPMPQDNPGAAPMPRREAPAPAPTGYGHSPASIALMRAAMPPPPAKRWH